MDGLHDAGAALVVDGRIVAAANEERFTRVKLQGGWPRESLAAVFAAAGVTASDVDTVAMSGLATPTLLTRLVRPLQRLYGPSMGICFDRPWHPLDRAADLMRYRLGFTRSRPARGAGRVEGGLAPAVLRAQMPRALRSKSLHFVDHHLGHAESAWRTAGPGDWLVVTADAHGDGRSLTVYLAREGAPALVLVHEEGVRASLGAFYAYVTRALGFRPGRHEGKVLGLSARGDEAKVPWTFPFRWEGEALRYDGDWGLKGMKRLEALRAFAREDVAAWVQRGLERVLLAGVARWREAAHVSQVAVAGGVFANVLLNGKIAALPGVERLHVFPHMGDGGLAAGAALHVAGGPPQPMNDLYLGPDLAPADCRRAAAASGLPHEEPPDPDAALLDALLLGLPVARAVGRLEMGPRALGHRSILAPADRPALTGELNLALDRDDFMPFAPILPFEDGAACFEGWERARSCVRTMTIALPARPEFAQRCPAAVHVDGTARPQGVEASADPALHALVRAYVDRSGRPALVNTSFNMHEEPIVASAEDAVRAFRAAGLPLLRLGPVLVRNPASRWR
jgi:carbamoyltransferase